MKDRCIERGEQGWGTQGYLTCADRTNMACEIHISVPVPKPLVAIKDVPKT